jgi:MATE family multidrug resistance protein
MIQTTDVIMLGWYGIEPLAGSVLAAQVSILVFLSVSGFAFAVMPMVANAVGADDDVMARRSLRMGFWVVGFFAALGMIFLSFLEPILLLLGQDPVLSGIADDYMAIALWGFMPAVLVMVLRSYFSAMERANIILYVTLVAVVVNAIGNYMFIFGNWGAPEWGVQGSAGASVVTNLATLVFLVLYAKYAPMFREKQLFAKLWRPDPQVLNEILRLGTPIAIALLAESGLFTAASLMIGWLGTIPLATHAIVLQIVTIFFMVPLGLANVATIRTGNAIGRKDPAGLNAAAIAVVTVAVICGFVFMLIYIGMPRFLISLFLEDSEPNKYDIMVYGVGLLAVAAAFQIVDSSQVVLMGVLRGMKDTKVPMYTAIVCYWMIGVPVAYILAFPLGYGGQGVWAGLVVGLFLAGIVFYVRYRILFARIKEGVAK